MHETNICVLGPPGRRTEITETLTRLGWRVAPEEGAELLMLDAREGRPAAELARRLRQDPRPALVLAGRPGPELASLTRRDAQTLLALDAGESGMQVGLATLAALARAPLANGHANGDANGDQPVRGLNGTAPSR